MAAPPAVKDVNYDHIFGDKPYLKRSYGQLDTKSTTQIYDE